MTIRKIYLTVAALMFAAAAYGQQDDLNRSVDIAKDYAPRVGMASKLSIRPRPDDTTSLRPDLEYTVRPRAWTGGLGVAPIRAARMNTGTYNAQYPLYIKAGGGLPGQSVFNLRATSTRPGATGFGVYADHRGHYSDIENFDGVENRATSTSNNIGIFGRASFGRLSLAGEVGWDYDLVSYYGDRGEWIPILTPPYGVKSLAPVSKMQHYSTPRASVLFGHDFTDLSRVNFRLGADGYMLGDRYDHKETGGNVFLELGRRFGVHDLTLRAGLDAWKGGGNNKDTESMILGISPDYKYSAGAFLFRMGATFAYETPDEVNFGSKTVEKKIWFLPRLEFKLTLAGGAFTPYARLDSRITHNSYRNLTAQNPYIVFESMLMAGTPAAEVNYHARAGFSGSVAGAFSYDIFAGYNIDRNRVVFRYYGGNGFSFDFAEKVKYFTLGAELEARIGSAFAVMIDGRYDGYRKKDAYFYYCLPQYEAGIALRYSHRDRFVIKAGARVRDGIGFYSIPDSEIMADYKSDTSVDVSLAADYNVSDRLGIFVEGRNLADQDIYPLPFYRGVGINVSAGVKLKF